MRRPKYSAREVARSRMLLAVAYLCLREADAIWYDAQDRGLPCSDADLDEHLHLKRLADQVVEDAGGLGSWRDATRWVCGE